MTQFGLLLSCDSDLKCDDIIISYALLIVHGRGKSIIQKYENVQNRQKYCSGQATLTSNKVDGDFTAFGGTVEV